MAEAARVLLLDLDNTLIDRDGAFRRWAADLLDRSGIDPVSDEGSRILSDLVLLDRRGLCDREDFCRMVAGRHPRLASTPEGLWREHRGMADFVEETSGVRSMLERLAVRWSLRVVSNGSGDLQRRKMTRAGLEGLFHSVWISGEQGMEKPDPEIFRRALGGEDPARVVMVGDDPFRDMEPARALGIATVHVDPSHGFLAPLPHGAISRILQLEEILP